MRHPNDPAADREPTFVSQDSWKRHAACAHHPEPELFYPDRKALGVICEAKQVCAVCPVSSECLLDALALGESNGIRGGLTESERKPLHKRAKPRIEHGRVLAVLNGVPGHLSEAERGIAVEIAHELNLPAAQLAAALAVGVKHARKLINDYRERLAHAAQAPEDERVTRWPTGPHRVTDAPEGLAA